MEYYIKAAIAAVCTFAGLLWGGWDGLMLALIVLIVLDYISGVIAAAIEKKLSSSVGAKGIAKKIFMLLVVAVANIVDVYVIGKGNVLRAVTISFYISNECISLIENASRIGVPIPNKLLNALSQLKDDNNK